MESSAEHSGRDDEYELAFPAPPKPPPKPPVRAFPPPPPPPVTPATRAFPPPQEPSTVRYGERVLRDTRAEAAPSARFDVDLRQRDALPQELLDRVRAEAEAAGFAAGWAEGKQEAVRTAAIKADEAAAEAARAAAMQHERIELALTALGAAATALERRSVPAAHDIEQQIVATGFEVARAVLDRELRTATEPGREALTRAMRLAPEASPVTVRLNPADRMTIGVSELVIDGRTVTLVDDPNLRPGDAMAQCDATTIDARLEPALERVREVLGL